MDSTSTSVTTEEGISNCDQINTTNDIQKCQKRRFRTKARRAHLIHQLEKCLILEAQSSLDRKDRVFASVPETLRKFELDLHGICLTNLTEGLKRSYLIELNDDQTQLRLTNDIKKIEDTKVFVEHIPARMTEKRLSLLLDTHGHLLNVKLPFDKSGTVKGYAFVQFSTPQAANRVINASKKVPYSYLPPKLVVSGDESSKNLSKNRVSTEKSDISLIKTEQPNEENAQKICEGNLKKQKKRCRKSRKKKYPHMNQLVDSRVRSQLVVLPFDHWKNLKESFKTEQKKNMGKLKRDLNCAFAAFEKPVPKVDSKKRGFDKIMDKLQVLHETAISKAVNLDTEERIKDINQQAKD